VSTPESKLKQLFTARKKSPRKVWGLYTGFDELDKLTGGIQARELTVLTARTNVGKSAFAGTLALNIAERLLQIDSPKRVRVVLLEMGSLMFQMRLACGIARLPITQARSGFITDEEYKCLMHSIDYVEQLPIDFLEGRTPSDEIIDFIAQSDTAWWCVDHIGIVKSSSGGYGSRKMDQLTELSQKFSTIAHTFAPGMVVAQQNRDSENFQNKNKTPTLGSIGGADAIGHDADIVYGLYRPALYDENIVGQDPFAPEQTQLLILKNRNGPTGKIALTYDKASASFIGVKLSEIQNERNGSVADDLPA